MFGKILDKVVAEVKDVTNDPVGYAVGTVTSPVADTLDILDGISEGELRKKAAIRLGADIVAGLAMSEIVELLTEDMKDE